MNLLANGEQNKLNICYNLLWFLQLIEKLSLFGYCKERVQNSIYIRHSLLSRLLHKVYRKSVESLETQFIDGKIELHKNLNIFVY